MAVSCLSHRLLLRTDRGARLDPADAIGESDEAARVRQFLADSDPAAVEALTTS